MTLLQRLLDDQTHFAGAVCKLIFDEMICDDDIAALTKADIEEMTREICDDMQYTASDLQIKKAVATIYEAIQADYN